MTYAFSFDASACTGCKACQEACKDKNQLPVGILWRRVVEVSGGKWHKADQAWENSVFAYNLSVACNHCTHPKCAGVCPTDAYVVREDGIVLIDASRCMGCSYCTWACPYGAPQYDLSQGVVTKCDFCFDNLDAGLPPSCVAACPLRVLNFGDMEETNHAEKCLNLWQLPGSNHPYPLPDYSRTEPHLTIKVHPGMNYALEKKVSNLEEVIPPQPLMKDLRKPFRDIPLVVFTLGVQMAVGMAVCGLLLPQLPPGALVMIGVVLVFGGLISFLHLGCKRNAWRAVVHLKKSWLSREILMTGMFSIAWAVSTGVQLTWVAPPPRWPMAILGIGLTYCMSRVYMLRAVPRWNSWRTPVSFLLCTILLGILALNLFNLLEDWIFLAGIVLFVEIILTFTSRRTISEALWWVRTSLLGLGILGIVLTAILPLVWDRQAVLIVFVIVLVAEIIGRWQFYSQRTPFPITVD
jgi:anaerobic dimethyl sulfoxide reductase subunit B (iron-sulfur subunit)